MKDINRLRYGFPFYDDLTFKGSLVLFPIFSFLLYLLSIFIVSNSNDAVELGDLVTILTFFLGLSPVIWAMKKDYKLRKIPNTFSICPKLHGIVRNTDLKLKIFTKSLVKHHTYFKIKSYHLRKAGRRSPVINVPLPKEEVAELLAGSANSIWETHGIKGEDIERLPNSGRYDFYAYIEHFQNTSDYESESNAHYFTCGVTIHINKEMKQVSKDRLYQIVKFFYDDPLSLKE